MFDRIARAPLLCFMSATAAALLLLCATGARADDKLRVGTPEPTAYVFSPTTVGIDSGIFKKHGLDIERIDFAGGAKMHQAMTAGALDVIIGPGSDIPFLLKGAPERVVAAYANDLNSVSLVVRSDDTVKTIADLKDKTVGTTTAGSFTTWVAKTILANHDIRSDQFKLAYLGAMNGLIAGLRRSAVADAHAEALAAEGGDFACGFSPERRRQELDHATVAPQREHAAGETGRHEL